MIRPACWINTLPAGGIVLMPEASSSCSCSYSFQTSLALIADDRHEEWGAYTCEPPKPGSALKTVAFNFGGVGDKRDEDGRLWLGFPRPFSPQNLRVPLAVEDRDLKEALLAAVDLPYITDRLAAGE